MANHLSRCKRGREKSSFLSAAYPRAALDRCGPQRETPARASGGGHLLTTGAGEGRRLARAAWGGGWYPGEKGGAVASWNREGTGSESITAQDKHQVLSKHQVQRARRGWSEKRNPRMINERRRQGNAEQGGRPARRCGEHTVPNEPSGNRERILDFPLHGEGVVQDAGVGATTERNLARPVTCHTALRPSRRA